MRGIIPAMGRRILHILMNVNAVAVPVWAVFYIGRGLKNHTLNFFSWPVLIGVCYGAGLGFFFAWRINKNKSAQQKLNLHNGTG